MPPAPAFGGFEAPLTNRAAIKAGSAVPISFAAAAGAEVSVRPCGGPATALAGLRPGGEGRWKVVWKTAKGATGCHVVAVRVGSQAWETTVTLR